ncbi:TPA_asm: ORFX protein [Juglans nigra waikavirus]|uniref:ORFX protein n=1 Tax=Juglans nigra waikavirus TaxID=3027342 RepID=A0AA48P940_9SECO|nr:TPA_asm: ORFX protein [Juglans nigra waikavirus]
MQHKLFLCALITQIVACAIMIFAVWQRETSLSMMKSSLIINFISLGLYTISAVLNHRDHMEELAMVALTRMRETVAGFTPSREPSLSRRVKERVKTRRTHRSTSAPPRERRVRV